MLDMEIQRWKRQIFCPQEVHGATIKMGHIETFLGLGLKQHFWRRSLKLNAVF